MISFILAQYLVLVLVSTLFGAQLNQMFKLNLNTHLNMILGFIAILSISYGLSIVWVLLRLNTFSFYIVLSLLLSLSLLTSLINIKKCQFSSYKFYGLGIIIVLILMALTFRYSFGIRSFDGAVYLSSILDNINAPFLNAFSPYDGEMVSRINVENDYQSFYYLNSYFLWGFTQVQLFLKSAFYPSLSSVYLVSMTAFYFTFLYHLVLGTIASIQLKSKIIISFIFIYFFLYFTSSYFNSSLSFLGQSYRTLIIGFMTLVVYLNIKNCLEDKQSIYLLSLSAFAAISTSSSAYFIAFIVLYAWLFIKIQASNKIDFIKFCVIAAQPILLFVILYVFSNTSYILGLLMFMIGLSILMFKFANYLIDLKLIVRLIIPLAITFVSIGFVLFKGSSITNIFTQASVYDMVFDYFGYSNPIQIFINGFLWTSLIILIIKGDKALRNYYLVVFIVFINPLNFVFLNELLASKVVHRVFDVLFNPVSLILMFSLSLSYLNRKIRYALLGILVIISVYTQTEVYHFVFIRPENSSYIERIALNEIEVLNVLNTKIILENLERPKVISQIHAVKAHVKGIILPLNYGTYRTLSVYDEVVFAPSELWNIFVYRDYETMRIFKPEPDYVNTCKYLINEKVNFVLVARNQFYRENGNFVPLYFRVRDCATLVYENDDYLLYQFYW
jgi:hypothetical protein